MVYVFKRQKHDYLNKKIIKEDVTVEEARKMCMSYNEKNPNSPYWLEWSASFEHAGGRKALK